MSDGCEANADRVLAVDTLPDVLAESLHIALWGVNSVPGMTSGGVHKHTTDMVEHAAQREYVRRCIRHAIGRPEFAAALATPTTEGRP